MKEICYQEFIKLFKNVRIGLFPLKEKTLKELSRKEGNSGLVTVL